MILNYELTFSAAPVLGAGKTMLLLPLQISTVQTIW